MSRPMLRATLAASLFVFVAACQKDADQGAAVTAPSAATPEATVMTSIQLLKQGDIGGLMQNALPPADFAKAKADWGKDRDDDPISDEDRARFDETMAKLTAPDAEQALFAEIEPKLKEFDATYQQAIPMYATMGATTLKGMIQDNQTLSENERTQAVAAVDAIEKWVKSTRFTDPESVKKVIAIVARTARSLDLKSLDQARSLDYDQSMQKARIAFTGVKDVLAVYGFSLDQTLDSVQAKTLTNDGKTANVQLSYTLLGTPLQGTTEMVNVDGRWYGKQTIEKLKEKAEADATSATAPAATPSQG